MVGDPELASMTLPDSLIAFVHLADVALWIGYAVLGIGAVCAAVAVLTFVPYLALSQCWKYLRTQDDFIRIASRYFDEKNKRPRRLMGTDE